MDSYSPSTSNNTGIVLLALAKVREFKEWLIKEISHQTQVEQKKIVSPELYSPLSIAIALHCFIIIL